MAKVLSGTVRADAGEIRFDGRPVRIDSPLAAQERGIETVYQDLALAPDLDPAANLFLGRELLRPGFLGRFGVLNLARFSTTAIGGHSPDNLSASAAVVLGGTSLFGGVGTIFGTVVGAFVPAVLQNGFVILGVQSYWQSVAVGAVLVAAVYLDQWRRRSRQRQ